MTAGQVIVGNCEKLCPEIKEIFLRARRFHYIETSAEQSGSIGRRFIEPPPAVVVAKGNYLASIIKHEVTLNLPSGNSRFSVQSTFIAFYIFFRKRPSYTASNQKSVQVFF